MAGEATIDLQSQLTTLVSGYGTASLAGTYAASCFGGTAADLNYVTSTARVTSRAWIPTIFRARRAITVQWDLFVNSDGTFSGVWSARLQRIQFQWRHRRWGL